LRDVALVGEVFEVDGDAELKFLVKSEVTTVVDFYRVDQPGVGDAVKEIKDLSRAEFLFFVFETVSVAAGMVDG
jgi:hypothetical protein